MPNLPKRVETSVLEPARVAPTCQHALEHVESPAPRARMMPLAPQRFGLQVTFDQETHDLLQYARALMGHQNPTGEIAPVLRSALRLLVGHLEKQKFAATSCPRPGSRRLTGSDVGGLARAAARHIPAPRSWSASARRRSARATEARGWASCVLVPPASPPGRREPGGGDRARPGACVRDGPQGVDPVRNCLSATESGRTNALTAASRARTLAPRSGDCRSRRPARPARAAGSRSPRCPPPAARAARCHTGSRR